MNDEDRLVEVLTSLPLFSENYLYIRPKVGKKHPFKLNRAQLFLDKRLDAQLEKTKRVRALVLKGRQQGISTYVAARFFRKVIIQKGKYAYILAHKANATKNLFNITKKYNDDLPEGLAPKLEKSSASELYFKDNDSGYAVGTAGSKDIGRSFTIQFLHGSEVGFWENTDEIQTGLLQTIPDTESEIILESTANGMNNFFHKMWVGACEGKNGYQAIFIPWYWQEEYVAELVDGDSPNLTDEEEIYYDLYHKDGLTKAHLYWRRLKIRGFPGTYEQALEKFNQEYPFSASEAFRNPVDNRFINAKLVMNARRNTVESHSPLVIGFDPALSDTDRAAIIRRKGRLAYKLETHLNHNTMQLVGIIKRIIDDERPKKVCIDCIGIGAGIVDRLHELGYQNIVEGVNVARAANNTEQYKNLRAELWDEMKQWLLQEMPVQIPDDDNLMGDITSLGYKFDSSGRLQIESKEDLKKRGIPSPDRADALALTFAVGEFLHVGGYTANFIPEKAKGMFT